MTTPCSASTTHYQSRLTNEIITYKGVNCFLDVLLPLMCVSSNFLPCSLSISLSVWSCLFRLTDAIWNHPGHLQLQCLLIIGICSIAKHWPFNPTITYSSIQVRVPATGTYLLGICKCSAFLQENTHLELYSCLVLCMALLQAKSQAKPSQMSWPEAGFGLALEFRSQSQASKPLLWMNIYLIIYNKLL